MALKRIAENPIITDTILFDILTPDEDGCFVSDCPYKVTKVQVYFLEKSFVENNYGKYEVQRPDPALSSLLEAAQKTACLIPTEENLKIVSEIQQQIELAANKETIRYADAKLIATFGSDEYPAWIDPTTPGVDAADNVLTLIDEDADGNTQYGHFEMEWTPSGQREGNYFICWTWSPVPYYGTEDLLTAHEYFTIGGTSSVTNNILSHYTDPKKYELLLKRYLPSTFDTLISAKDMSPYIIRGLNNSVAQGFAFLEDMMVQIVDLIDANIAPQQYLIPLANYFNIKLRSSDPTLWRRQIKRAIPLLKKKGTLDGLKEALSQAGVELINFTKLWQVISPSTWQEHFTIVDALEFTLAKTAILPQDSLNLELYYRGVDDDWEKLETPLDHITLDNVSGETHMEWTSSTISLVEGDSIRIIYKITEVTNQSIEDYIRSLSLMDLRDERDQLYPPKNWNVRMLEEFDPFFDVIIRTRHPYYDPIIWGFVRTEVPYSEQAYNMEEYDGSTRESINPCDIDKEFVDPCNWGQSSKYTVDLGIENLSNDRLLELQEILKEFTPFHAILHSINLSSIKEEFIQPRDEITFYIHVKNEQPTIAGNGQMIFNRVMINASQGRRDLLADMTSVPDDLSKTGIGVNQNIMLYSPLVQLKRMGLRTENILEILNGSDAGVYSISNSTQHHAEIVGVVEPFSSSVFTFRLSNKIFENVTTNIYQDDIFRFSDTNIDFTQFQIKTIEDQSLSPSVIPWKVDITAPAEAVGSYEIASVDCSNIILDDPTKALPTTSSDINYSLLDSEDVVVLSSSTGGLISSKRGRVDMSSLPEYSEMQKYITIGYYLEYLGTQYQITGFKENDFYIDEYEEGEVVGVSTNVYQRICNNEPGYLYYDGMVLTTDVDYEALFGIKNGANAPVDEHLITDNNLFKQNYLILIGTDYYAISEWDGTNIYLAGPPLDWGVAIGASVSYKIYHFTKNTWSVLEKVVGHPTGKPEIVVPGHDFTFLDRRGNEVIEINTEEGVGMLGAVVATTLNAGKNNEVYDIAGQSESISYQIEYR